jgi:alpha-D-ribose 1-methylphosphonate 5-triphosphate synthase subunit PhnI
MSLSRMAICLRVNVAARFEQLWDPGGADLGHAYDHLHGKLGLALDYAGEQHVENTSRAPCARIASIWTGVASLGGCGSDHICDE